MLDRPHVDPAHPGELRPDVAERVAHRNAAKLYRLE